MMTNSSVFLRLASIAREERARRADAVAGTPHAGTQRAIQDDALWFHIERRALRAAGDAAALRAQPRWYSPDEMIAMASSARATLKRAVTALDGSIAVNVTKMLALRDLCQWLELPALYPMRETT
jgi:hypothetical protein